MFGGNFAPRGWAFCSGQLMSIAQDTALFALLGTTYGGDGQVTFALPDLRGRFPLGQGTGPGLTPRTVGEAAGSENVTLTQSQIPSHTHAPSASSAAATQTSPQNQVWAVGSPAPYSSGTPAATMHAAAIGSTGGSQPHENMVPFLGVNFIIAVAGIFPSRN